MHLSPAALDATIRMLETGTETSRVAVSRPTFAKGYGGQPSPGFEREGWWRRRESNPRPKARPRGTLHACPLLNSHARREEAAKNRRAPDSETSRDRTPSRRSVTSLFNDI